MDARLYRRLALLWAWVLLASGCATLPAPVGEEVAGEGGAGWVEELLEGPRSCTDEPLPSRWPDLLEANSKKLLEPFLECTPAGFVELQDAVDMPRLVWKLEPWEAVRLSAVGPVREDAAEFLNDKRVLFLLEVSEEYGFAYGEIFALYTLHGAYDDEVDALLKRLAADKQPWRREERTRRLR